MDEFPETFNPDNMFAVRKEMKKEREQEMVERMRQYRKSIVFGLRKSSYDSSANYSEFKCHDLSLEKFKQLAGEIYDRGFYVEVTSCGYWKPYEPIDIDDIVKNTSDKRIRIKLYPVEKP